MKVFLTVATIIAICASIIMGILLLTDPGPRALGTDQIEKYDLPGETEVVNYYLLADEIKFDYTASSRRVEITKDNRTLSFQLYDKLVIDLGVEKWTQLERNDDIATLLPPCKYIQITLNREANKPVNELFKDMACKQALDTEAIVPIQPQTQN